MPRTHNREYFYKYVTADTAEKILESGMFLWSAPHLFNDPFDHQINYRFPFTGEEVAEKLCEVFERIVFGEFEPTIVQQKKLGILSLRLRQQELKGNAKDIVMNKIRIVADETVGLLGKYQSDINNTFVERQSFVIVQQQPSFYQLVSKHPNNAAVTR